MSYLSSLRSKHGFAAAFVIGTLLLTGCSTTHEVRPTASVMVGTQHRL